MRAFPLRARGVGPLSWLGFVGSLGLALACTASTDAADGGSESGGAASTGGVSGAVGGSGGSASGGTPGSGASANGGAVATGGAATGGAAATGGTATGGSSGLPVDCSGITAAGYEVCTSGGDACGVVFTDGAGCAAVCAAAGLVCETAYEDVDGQCAADETLPALPCDSGHQSDYCLCRGAATGTGGAGTGGAGTGGAGTGGTGAETGGTGGVATGGTSSGGTSTGGASTGGTSTGGSSSTGGSGTGGSPGVVGSPIGFATLNGGTKGGLGGQTVTVSTLADLKKYAESSTPYVILVQGTITNGSAGGQVNVQSNKSIVGIGSTAFLQGVGIQIKNANNVILQNLKITLVGTSTPSSVNGGDAIVINGTSKNVWIDHCELYSEDPTVQTNIDKYDGLIDIRDQTGFITVSWSYIHDHHKGCLVGAADTDLYADRKVTYHHNHFKKIVKRMPMYRGAVGHFFNNYVNGVPTTEATFVVKDTCLRVEKNVYENVKYAIYSGDVPGKAERIDNIGSQSRAWPASCTANIPYDYSSALTTTTSDVKTVVPAGAGVGKL